MTLDVSLATFSAAQLVFAAGAAAIAFGLRKTFEGGIFEKAWRVIAIAPILYALAEAIELSEAVGRESSDFGSIASIAQVLFLVILFSGFFMFASAWGGSKRKGGGGGPSKGSEDTYSRAAKGAMVYILGNGGASRVMFYTGEPDKRDFESKLHGVLGNGAETVMRRMLDVGDGKSE